MEKTQNANVQNKSLARMFLDVTVPLRLRLGLTKAQIATSPWGNIISVSHPDSLKTDLFPQETELLLRMFRESRPLTYLEIGVFWGGTFKEVLQCRDALSLPTKCFGLDVWDEIKDSTNNTHISNWPNRGAVKRALKRAHFRNFELLSGLSSQVRDLINCKIDFVFHDANHTYAAVRDDLERLYPMLSDGATVVIHNASNEFEPDKIYYQADGGPYQAVMDLVKLGKWDLKTLEYRVAVLKKSLE